MANTSRNTTAAIRQQVYGSLLQKTLDDGYLPDGFMFDITEFSDGDTYNMPTVGDLSARSYDQSVVEDQEIQSDALDTGRITLSITNYDGVSWYETRKLSEDRYLDIVGMKGLDRAMRAMKVTYESNALAAHNSVQTAASVNAVNGAAHRYVAGGTSQVIKLEDIAYARFALDKANVPDEGLIGVVDPAWALTLDKLVGAQAFVNNPMFGGMVTEGFRKNMKFVRNIYGIDIYTSNRLPTIASESINASAYGLANASVTNGVANFFFSVASDDSKPVMHAMRRNFMVESWEDKKYTDTRDYYKITSRYGFATHRPQGLVTILSSKVG